uniref:Serpentine receptor class gamma n=1 Tax=Steinernema glaseri TaxID=37863 RepID=A0A1I7ZRD9_9BILA
MLLYSSFVFSLMLPSLYRTSRSTDNSLTKTAATVLFFSILSAWLAFFVCYIVISCFGYDNDPSSLNLKTPWFSTVDSIIRCLINVLFIGVGFWTVRQEIGSVHSDKNLIAAIFTRKAWLWISRFGACSMVFDIARLLVSTFMKDSYIRALLEALPSILASMQLLMVCRTAYTLRMRSPKVVKIFTIA